jgi:hypothetical protein
MILDFVGTILLSATTTGLALAVAGFFRRSAALFVLAALLVVAAAGFAFSAMVLA